MLFYRTLKNQSFTDTTDRDQISTLIIVDPFETRLTLKDFDAHVLHADHRAVVAKDHTTTTTS